MQNSVPESIPDSISDPVARFSRALLVRDAAERELEDLYIVRLPASADNPTGYLHVSKAAHHVLAWLYGRVLEGDYGLAVREGGSFLDFWVPVDRADLPLLLGSSVYAVGNGLDELTGEEVILLISAPKGEERYVLPLLAEPYAASETDNDPQDITTGVDPVEPSEALMRFAARFSLTCVYCKGLGTIIKGPDGRGWHRDHVFPKVHGGKGDAVNLVLACATCNEHKHTLAANEFLAKLAQESA